MFGRDHCGQLPRNVEIGGVTFHGGVEGEDHFVHLARADTIYQRSDGQIARRHPVHGADHAAQHMVEAGIDTGALNGHYVLHVLHHTDLRMVAPLVGTDFTHLVVADVVAVCAVFHLVAQSQEAVGQRMGHACVFAQEVQNEAQGGFSSHTRQFGRFGHGALKQLGGKLVYFHIAAKLRAFALLTKFRTSGKSSARYKKCSLHKRDAFRLILSLEAQVGYFARPSCRKSPQLFRETREVCGKTRGLFVDRPRLFRTALLVIPKR